MVVSGHEVVVVPYAALVAFIGDRKKHIEMLKPRTKNLFVDNSTIFE
jgi:hypothetical protein